MRKDSCYVVFDVETPNHLNDKMSSIGIVVIEDGKIVDSYSSLINPECIFDEFNINLTHISPMDVANKPTFKDLWPTLKKYFDKGVLVAHNARFDLTVLARCLKAYGIEYKSSVEYVCTLDVAYKVFTNIKNRKLNTICEYLNIELNHHDALSDASACANILLYYQNEKVKLHRFKKKFHFYHFASLKKTCPYCGHVYSKRMGICPRCHDIDFENIINVEIIDENEVYKTEVELVFDPVKSAYLEQMDGHPHFECDEVEKEIYYGKQITFEITYKDESYIERAYFEEDALYKRLMVYVDKEEKDIYVCIKEYLEEGPLSKEELIHYLEKENYKKKEIEAALIHMDIDFYEECVRCIEELLKEEPYSYKEMYTYLSKNLGYEVEDIYKALNLYEGKWQEYALKAGKNYKKANTYSRVEMYTLLENDGYTKEECEYACDILYAVKEDTMLTFTLPEDYASYFDTRIKERGRAIYQNNDILEVYALNEKEVVAKVNGTIPYSVVVKFSKDKLKMKCNCPYLANCKHEYAVLEYIKEHPQIPVKQKEVNMKHTPLEEFTLLISEMEYNHEIYGEKEEEQVNIALSHICGYEINAQEKMKMLFLVMKSIGVDEEVFALFKSLYEEDMSVLEVFKSLLNKEYYYSFIEKLGSYCKDEKFYIAFIESLLKLCDEEEKMFVEEAIFYNRTLRKLTRHLFGYIQL